MRRTDSGVEDAAEGLSPPRVQRFGALPLDVLGNSAVEVGRGGSGARREPEHMEIGKPDLLDSVAGCGKRDVVLSGESDDEVRPEGRVGETVSHALDHRSILASRVPTAHPVQDAIVAALEGNVKVTADAVIAGAGIEEGIVDSGQIDRRNPESDELGKVEDLSDQIGE